MRRFHTRDEALRGRREIALGYRDCLRVQDCDQAFAPPDLDRAVALDHRHTRDRLEVRPRDKLNDAVRNGGRGSDEGRVIKRHVDLARLTHLQPRARLTVPPAQAMIQQLLRHSAGLPGRGRNDGIDRQPATFRFARLSANINFGRREMMGDQDQGNNIQSGNQINQGGLGDVGRQDRDWQQGLDRQQNQQGGQGSQGNQSGDPSDRTGKGSNEDIDQTGGQVGQGGSDDDR